MKALKVSAIPDDTWGPADAVIAKDYYNRVRLNYIPEAGNGDLNGQPTADSVPLQSLDNEPAPQELV